MNPIESFAVEIACEAGDIIRTYFNKAHIKAKASNDLVTEADIKVELHIKKRILEQFPSNSFMAEETAADIDPMAENLWIIDPIDGTNNYAHGIPHSCISIAYAEKGTVKAGVVYDPFRDEMYRASEGNGTFCNDQPLYGSTAKTLSSAIIATGFYYDRGEMMRKTLGSIEALFANGLRGIRRIGSAALDLAWVAHGRFGGYFEYQLNPWDYAAGMLLVQEAGGTCLDRAGNPLHLNSCNIIAATPTLIKEMLPIIHWPESVQK